MGVQERPAVPLERLLYLSILKGASFGGTVRRFVSWSTIDSQTGNDGLWVTLNPRGLSGESSNIRVNLDQTLSIRCENKVSERLGEILYSGLKFDFGINKNYLTVIFVLL